MDDNKVSIREIAAEETIPLRIKALWPEAPNLARLNEDDDGLHYGLFVNDCLISVISLFYDNHKIQFRKFATHPDYQGNGYGTRLLKFVIDQYLNNYADIIWCNARMDKVSFYKRFGMSKTGKKFTKAGISYVIMEKRLNKKVMTSFSDNQSVSS